MGERCAAYKYKWNGKQAKFFFYLPVCECVHVYAVGGVAKADYKLNSAYKYMGNKSISTYTYNAGLTNYLLNK